MDVEEVVEPAVFVGYESASVAAQSAAGAIFGLVARDPLALCTDAESGEAEARNPGAAAGFVSFFCVVGWIAVDEVPADSCLGVACVPEVLEAAVGEIVEQGIVVVAAAEEGWVGDD